MYCMRCQRQLRHIAGGHLHEAVHHDRRYALGQVSVSLALMMFRRCQSTVETDLKVESLQWQACNLVFLEMVHIQGSCLPSSRSHMHTAPRNVPLCPRCVQMPTTLGGLVYCASMPSSPANDLY